MNRSRSHGIVIATIAATSVASLALGIATLNGFGASGAGDLLVSSTPAASTVLLLIGVVVLIELELSHLAGRRSRRTTRAAALEPAHA
ncbi:MAG: hypothetical protein ABSD62_02475 [Candidatus Limnocylindrales bacterium]|jgi:hypothetical protein